VPLLLSLPGIGLVALAKRRRPAWPLAAILLVYGALTLFAGFWSPRYFLCLLVLAAVLGALALDAGAAALASRRLTRAGAWLLAPALAGAGALALSRQVETFGPVLTDLRRLDRRAFLDAHVDFWKLADWLNQNSRKDDRIGIGVNVQPFYYLERSYFHIHPASEKGDLLHAASPEDFLQRFRRLGITVLVIYRWNYERNSLPPPGAPHLQAFLKRLYNGVNTLRRQKRIRHLADVSGAAVYRLPDGADTGPAP